MSRFGHGQFAKPENALKRAVRPQLHTHEWRGLTTSAVPAVTQEELINVGQKNAALQALHDVITSKVGDASAR